MSLNSLQLLKMQSQWKISVETEDLVKRYVPHLKDSQIESYIKEIGRIWQIFEIKTKDHSWIIAKNHDQIQEFIIKYNLKYKAKLLFGSFMLKGVTQVCSNPQVMHWDAFLKFFQHDQLEIKKVKCMKLLKKSGGRYKDYFCCRLPWQWNPRDFVIIKSGVLYYSKNKQPKQYLPFGANFKIFKGKADTGYQFGIQLEANHRKLLLHAESCLDFFQFIYFIQQTQQQALSDSQHRYNSFAPVRNANHVHFFIDGEDYFRGVAEGIERAQAQIMIAGWYISPQFQLVRPVSANKDKRLDTLLKKAAQRGLKIFILVYNESSFLTNDSAYVKQALEALSPAIKVLQHPLGVLPTFWSHHEKVVIIDQHEAFMGGLDLGFARFDNSQHLINCNDADYYPGMEYNNVRNTDLTRVRQFWRDGVERSKARLPWHDVAVHLAGEAVADLSHHFIEYWNYASFQTYYQDRYVLVLKNEDKSKPLLRKIGDGIAKKFKTIRVFAGELKDKLFHSKEKEREGPPKVKEEEIRIDLRGDGSSEIIMNRYRKPLQFKADETFTDYSSPFSFKEESVKSSESSEKELKKGSEVRRYNSMVELDDMVEGMGNTIEKIDFMNENVTLRHIESLHQIQEEVEYEHSCQVLRSVGSWSIGCEPSRRERSIHTAYLDLIRTARRFIYIENQFFISMTSDSSSTVKNEIANEIFKRVSLAVLNKEEFKVWIVIPLIPGFAGELDDPDAVIPRVIMHWQYNTIDRSPGGLMTRIADLGVDPSHYVSIFGLRTHGIVSGKPQTEIVYLHSKLMIVDDEKAIIGSANINERSMRGSRDSEVCLLIQEGQQKIIKYKESALQVSEEIHNFRVRLFHEHFGEDLDVLNPSTDQTFHSVKERAARNTGIYREIFRCYPDDYIKTLRQLTEMRGTQANTELYQKYKADIRGFVVEYPLQFLKEENLLIGATLYPDSLSV